jgi:uncharacterized protein (TIGR00290 family)
MPYALMTSGGKDATLALDRTRRDGLDVRLLVTLYDGAASRVRYHWVRRELLHDQARALGLELLAVPTPPDTYEPVFNDVLVRLRERGYEGVIFGNVHLADVRAWYERRVRAAGLKHVEPLWGEPSVEVAWTVVERGYRAVVVSVNLAERATRFLGCEFDADLVTQITVMEGLDPCGERGEYHTFVFDGPEFRHPVGFSRGQITETDGHRFVDLIPLNGKSEPEGTQAGNRPGAAR